MKDDKDKPRKSAPAANTPSPATQVGPAADDEPDEELPEAPEALQKYARDLARKYRAARRQLEKAGLTKEQERTLVGEVAKLAAVQEEVRARLAELTGDDDDDDQEETGDSGETAADPSAPTCPFTIF